MGSGESSTAKVEPARDFWNKRIKILTRSATSASAPLSNSQPTPPSRIGPNQPAPQRMALPEVPRVSGRPDTGKSTSRPTSVKLSQDAKAEKESGVSEPRERSSANLPSSGRLRSKVIGWWQCLKQCPSHYKSFALLV